MIYKIKTMGDIAFIADKFPDYAVNEARRIAAILDECYNSKDMDGGFILAVESGNDMEGLMDCIDITAELPEQITRIGDYISVLYLPATEYSVSLIMPAAIAPMAITERITE